VAGVFIAVALSEELEDKKAAFPARNGMSAVAGLAVCPVNLDHEGAFAVAATHLAGPLRPQTLLSTAYWRQTKKEMGIGKEWRVKVVEWRSGNLRLNLDDVNDRCQAFIR
jgi:hypothetical protein